MEAEAAATAQSEWAWLPEHLLDSILDIVVSQSEDGADYFCFSAVCKRWLSVANHNSHKYPLPITVARIPHPPPPLLLIPSSDNDNSTHNRCLLDLADPQKRTVIELGSQYNKRCGGSSHGWLAFAKADISITLLNPFSGATIELPPIGEAPVFEDWEDPFPYCAYYVQKIILSADPSENPEYVVTVIYTDIMKVAFKRSTDKVWTHTKLWRINDIAYHRGRIYAVNNGNGVYYIDVHNPRDSKMVNDQIRGEWPNSRKDKEYCRYYLVECTKGCLYKVIKYADTDGNSVFTAKGVDVYKLKYEDGKPKWYRPRNLAGHAFFIGDNHSRAVVASDYPGVCRSNSIYFTDDQNCYCFFPNPDRGQFSVGVFHLKGRKMGTSYYVLDPSQKHMPPAIWIDPPKHCNN
ncbi:hypothetical protein Ancab_009039 [Ancistrocladus abbreviatus]